ncbi:MAG TPA: glycoside hydrolase family 43 protein [Chitinophagaceae bacterium]|nr:glycoside hydrolase family 43 protein [Chitinophagaceae bacterium]
MGNPIIKHKFTADPTVIVHLDTVYLYTGHDEPPSGVNDYVMKDWLCFSSMDLKHWQEYPSPLKATDFKWAKADAYASKVIERYGKFYWYVAVTHATVRGKAIGVAMADNPIGPFTDAKGKALIDSSHIPPTDNEKANLDPSVIIDNDGQAYIFWGNKQCYYAKLKSNMIQLDSLVQTISLPGFMEGVHVYKRKGWYYLMYGYEFPEKVAYAMSRNIHGPWIFKGVVNDIVFNCETNRPATLDLKEISVFFYHNGALENGGSHRRSVCADHLFYNEDGTIQKVIQTSKGVELVFS